MKAPRPSQQIAAANLYAKLMEEIKTRISAIDAGTTGTLRHIAPLIVREFCYLQIRMICELIALGCLVAHGDLTEATNLRKMWEADKIMDGLAKLHPDFFPYAVTPEKDATGYDSISPRAGCLTRTELLAMYVECGKHLHKGSLRNLLKERFPLQISFPEITALAQKLADLLAVHTVFMADAQSAFFCILRDQHNRVQVGVIEKAQSPPPEHAPQGRG